MRELETRLAGLRDAGDRHGLATAAIEGYGPQIFGFLLRVCDDEHVASEVFSQFCEDVWRGLDSFQWRCAFRTWAYAVARRALLRYKRDPWLRAEALTDESLARFEAIKRASTPLFLEAVARDKFLALRQQLDLEDRALLTLRIDRGLRWREIAVALGPESDLDEAELRKHAALLRKRFERLKDQLAELARSAELDD